MVVEAVVQPDHLDLHELIPSPEALACISVQTARSLCVLPVAICRKAQSRLLTIACINASNITLHERVAKHVDHHYQLQFVDSPEHQLRTSIEEFYRIRPSLQTLLDLGRSDQQHKADASSVTDYPVELINALVRQAARMRASDIHISPESDSVQIRFRVDGVLMEYARVSKAQLNSLLVRIKIMASLDIAETRYPQDGQFRRIIDAHPIDFRVSTFPTVTGENTVLRLIDDRMKLNCLSAFALPDVLVKRLRTFMQRPDGLIVVCGPTGAGKSTTLFALLEQTDHESLNIMTLEDPVEHRVPGIRQTTVDAARQWGYAQGVRALLRQDPDVLLIGEIRDAESCEMALRAVSTGHQVLTTVHAGCVHSALHRLRELKASGGALALGLVAMIAQRLVRKLCKACDASGVSCSECHGTGFVGRQVIMEVLEVSAEIRTLLVAEADISEIRLASANAGFIGLREQAMNMVEAGETSVQEVNRVLGSVESLNVHG